MAKVLVVDDSATNREFLQTLLGYAGHTVVGAGDGDEGLRLAHEQPPDLAIVDIVMPTMDGPEFVNRLRANLRLSKIPIIFYSASFLLVEAEKLALASGVHHVLQKPAEPEEILKIVNETLGLVRPVQPIPKIDPPDRQALLAVTLNKTQRELESISQRLAVLVDLAREFTTVTDPDRLLERLGSAARSVVGARFAVVAVVHENRDRISKLFTIGAGQPAWARSPYPPLTTGVFADLIRADKPTRQSGRGFDARDFGLSVDTQRIVSYLAVPIVVAGTTLGLLCLLNKIGGGEFSEDEARIADTMCAQAAVTLENIRLILETRRRLEFVNALRAIDVAITGSIDIRLTLDVILDQVVTHLGIDAAAILLYNRGTNFLEAAAARGFRTEEASRRAVKFGDGHAGTAAVERRTFGFGDASTLDPQAAGPPVIGGERFNAYFASPLVSKGRTLGVLEVFNHTPIHDTREWLGFLQALAAQAAIAIDQAELFNDLQQATINLTQAYDSTLEGWVHALDLRDKETAGHTRRVTELTVALARAFGFNTSELVHVRRGALLHDIGKLGIPDAILLKPGPLTEEEWTIMRRHPAFAYEWIRPISYLRPAADIPYCHHEKWDGSGYPRGLAGDSIPLAARLFAVADVWDALTSDRPYRPAWPRDKVIAHIRDLSGSHLDPDAVEAFFKLPEFTSPNVASS
jgi:response regulator RpfG family c-di-GMP phosphodiesterase